MTQKNYNSHLKLQITVYNASNILGFRTINLIFLKYKATFFNSQ